MNDTHRLERMLRVATAFFLFVGVAALLWPASIPSGELPPPELNVNIQKGAALPRADIQPIIAANVFSSRRAAPAQRYRSYWNTAPAEVAVVDSAVGKKPRPVADMPTLLGIVQGESPAALMRLDPAAAGAQLYHVGDRGGAYNVVSIDDQAVVLSGPAGRLVLRLKTSQEP